MYKHLLDMYKNIITNLTFIIMGLLSKPLDEAVINEQYKHNAKLWTKEKRKGYIENQNDLIRYQYGTTSAIVKKILFGNKNMTAADNSCEVIAVYNAILSVNNMQVTYHFPELIKSFSEAGIVLKGAFGTNPISLRKFFLKEGYAVGELKGDDIVKDKLLKLSEQFDSYIFCAYNKGYNPLSMLHTMCIEKKSGNNYIIHNDYEGGRCCSSLFDAVTGYNNGSCGPIYVLGLKKVMCRG